MCTNRKRREKKISPFSLWKKDIQNLAKSRSSSFFLYYSIITTSKLLMIRKKLYSIYTGIRIIPTHIILIFLSKFLQYGQNINKYAVQYIFLLFIYVVRFDIVK